MGTFKLVLRASRRQIATRICQTSTGTRFRVLGFGAWAWANGRSPRLFVLLFVAISPLLSVVVLLAVVSLFRQFE